MQKKEDKNTNGDVLAMVSWNTPQKHIGWNMTLLMIWEKQLSLPTPLLCYSLLSANVENKSAKVSICKKCLLSLFFVWVSGKIISCNHQSCRWWSVVEQNQNRLLVSRRWRKACCCDNDDKRRRFTSCVPFFVSNNNKDYEKYKTFSFMSLHSKSGWWCRSTR